jgi:uncharacterized protein with NAD-binding domain and iron-sulfur cluster
MGKRVVILGGGVAGMSAAQELAERGFEVHVYERQPLAGGKARSIPVLPEIGDRGGKIEHTEAVRFWEQYTRNSGAYAVKPWVPGEHGFRFFPSFYRHVIDSMSRIPSGSGSVKDNLTDTTQVLMAQYGKPGIVTTARFPRTLSGVQITIGDFLRVVAGDVGIPAGEFEFFGARIWQIISSCGERRLGEYEKIGWWEFIGANSRSAPYQKFLGHGITRSLVAAQAQKASTRTIGDIFVQLLLGIADPMTATSDRLFNQPTNHAWILPWLAHLRSLGVQYHFETRVDAFRCEGGSIRGVKVERAGKKEEIAADYYVAAIPIERMAPLVTPEMMRADPQLACLTPLSKNVDWMNGIQFYLTRDVPIVHGHAIYLDSSWAITSVSQKQFWQDVNLAEFGDGKVRGILSVDISDWVTPGLNGKAARDCKRQEIADEVWAELKASLNVGGRVLLRDEDLHYWYIDPDIADDPVHGQKRRDIEPLLVNLVDTWKLRPEAVTTIPNLFLASDYVRTYTDLATMEGANEAARRAVNGILAASGASATPCRLWPLHEPEIFQPLRAYDQARYRAGLPWDDRVLKVALSVLGLVQDSIASAAGGILPGCFGDGAPALDGERLLRLSHEIASLAAAPGTTLPMPASPGKPRLRITQKS